MYAYPKTKRRAGYPNTAEKLAGVLAEMQANELKGCGNQKHQAEQGGIHGYVNIRRFAHQCRRSYNNGDGDDTPVLKRTAKLPISVRAHDIA